MNNGSEIKGADELIIKLSSLGPKDANKALRKALDSIASKIQKDTKSKLPSFLSKMKQGVRKSYKKKNQTYFVDILGNKKNKSWMLRFFEGGTVERYTRKYKGKTKRCYRGKLKSYYFFRHSIDSNLVSVKEKLDAALKESIEKIFNKTNANT